MVHISISGHDPSGLEGPRPGKASQAEPVFDISAYTAVLTGPTGLCDGFIPYAYHGGVDQGLDSSPCWYRFTMSVPFSSCPCTRRNYLSAQGRFQGQAASSGVSCLLLHEIHGDSSIAKH